MNMHMQYSLITLDSNLLTFTMTSSGRKRQGTVSQNFSLLLVEFETSIITSENHPRFILALAAQRVGRPE